MVASYRPKVFWNSNRLVCETVTSMKNWCVTHKWPPATGNRTSKPDSSTTSIIISLLRNEYHEYIKSVTGL